MASLALEHHSIQHHLETDQRLFKPKLMLIDIKNSMRKSASDMNSRKSAVVKQTAVSAPPASLNHSHSYTTGHHVERENGFGSCRVEYPDYLVVDEYIYGKKVKCGDLRTSITAGGGTIKEKQNERCKDGENITGKQNHNSDRSNGNMSYEQLCSPVAGGQRDSMKDKKAHKSNCSPNGHHRSAGRRGSQPGVRNIPPNCWSDEEFGKWVLVDRVTQRMSGVVKILRSDRPRREAWSIFNQEDPRVKEEKGEGHVFTSRSVTQDWCDACNRLIRADARKCMNCSYTCHLECQDLVQLDCNQRDKQPEDAVSPEGLGPPSQDKNATKEEEETPKRLGKEEVKTKIDEYNAKEIENGMNLAEDGTYTGFIKVHLKLRRPVTVSSEPGPGSSAGPEGPDRKTSFYLPTDAVKQLHISSSTTVSEVIQGLLKKFMVLDNPGKFALYRQTHRDGQDLFQKLLVSEHPLYLRLLTGPDPERLTFVLKENETGEVEWHAFSVPELQNFLTILENEERERVRQVEQKYAAYRNRLQQALKEAQGKPG